MFSNEALSVVIGLTFIYLLYSLLATIIQEIVATNIQLRGLILRYSLFVILDHFKNKKKSFATTFYKHPLIKILKTGNFISGCPSYIEPDTFSRVIIDLLRGKNMRPGDPVKYQIQDSLDKKELAWETVTINNETIEYLNTIWADSQGDVQKFKALLEDWFNKMMVKTSGWYKQWTQLMLLIIGLLIAAVFNVDTISIVKKLENNPTLTEKIVSQANDFVKAHPNLEKELQDSKDAIDKMKATPARKDSLTANANAQYQDAKHLKDSLVSQAKILVENDIRKVNDLLGLGWKKKFFHFEKGTDIPTTIGGWILTALAISLGAPFWFDLLNKLMQLRGPVASKKKDDTDTTTIKITDRVG